MRIGIVAPPWIPVPPVSYDGTELAVEQLVRGLVRARHEVDLVAHPDSTVAQDLPGVTVHSPFVPVDGIDMGQCAHELAWTLAAYEHLRITRPDVIHDHTISGAPLGPELWPGPLVVTNHGPFDTVTTPVYERASRHAAVVALTGAHAATTLVPTTVVRHGLDVDTFPFGRGEGGHLLFLGRMSPDKGVHLAVEVAERSGLPLVIAAKARERRERRYLDEVIRPHLSDQIRFVEEPPTAYKLRLLADAIALVNPIRWPEPFGLAMAEALACGTPVLAFADGSAPELVRHGRTGFVCASVEEMTERVRQLDRLDRYACRAFVATQLTVERMIADHLGLYARARRAADVNRTRDLNGALDVNRTPGATTDAARSRAAAPSP